MANYSFDVVSEFDKAEMNNAFDQARREIGNRYDFKGTPAGLEWSDEDKNGFKITGNSDWQIDSILDIVRKKLAARNLNQKILDASKPAAENNMRMTKVVQFRRGLDQEKAKSISKLLRETLPKAKTQIQGDAVRVTSASKDELQSAIQLLRAKDFDFPLSFTNYR